LPTMVSGLSAGHSSLKILPLDLLLLGRRLDHQVAIGEIIERLGGRDALIAAWRCSRLMPLAADLARQVAADGGEPLGDCGRRQRR